MTFLIKIQLLNWQQNVYRSTSCPQNWASVCTSHINKPQSQVAITFEKHKLDEECFLSSVRAYDQTTLAEYSMHWCRCCWNWQNFLQQWLQYLNCSFSLQLQPRIIEHINYRPVTGGRCIEAKAKAGTVRGQGQGHDFGSSSCPRARGQSSRTPSLSDAPEQCLSIVLTDT